MKRFFFTVTITFPTRNCWCFIVSCLCSLIRTSGFIALIINDSVPNVSYLRVWASLAIFCRQALFIFYFYYHIIYHQYLKEYAAMVEPGDNDLLNDESLVAESSLVPKNLGAWWPWFVTNALGTLISSFNSQFYFFNRLSFQSTGVG